MKNLAVIVSNSLQHENIPVSMKKSYQHTGIFPYKPLKMSALLRYSKVKYLFKEDEQILGKLEELTKDHITELKEIVLKKRKSDEATPTV